MGQTNKTLAVENLIEDGITQEMIDVTSEKFKLWDEITKNNILEVGTEEEKARAFLLLADPTIYFYAFFKNPQNPSKPMKLYSYQDVILNDTHRFILFCAANQIGKSISLCMKAMKFVFDNPGKTVLMVSKTLPQSKDLLRQIKSYLNASILDYKYDVGESDTKTEIYFKNYEEYEEYDEDLDKTFVKLRELPQSRIICIPATEAALGYAVDLLLIDELAFYEDGEYFYKQIALPRTYTTKGQIIVFSNSNGQQGIFWELWNSPHFHKYRFNFLDCPTNTQEEFDQNCSMLTQEQIDSTMLAIFTDPEGGFISLAERNAMQEDRANMLPSLLTEPIYIFFDFAKSRDRTVRSSGVPVKDGNDTGIFVYEMKEYPQKTGYDDIVDDLENLYKEVGFGKIMMVGWDNTGVGGGINDFIKRVEGLGIMCMPVEFSLQNKSAMYTSFKFLMERNLKGKLGIKIPKVKECDQQLSKLRFKRSSGRGYLQVHHEKESDRDDFPDSLAGLCSLIIQPDSAPVTIEMIGGSDSQGRLSHKNDDTKRCDCGNILEDFDEKCSFCGKDLKRVIGIV